MRTRILREEMLLRRKLESIAGDTHYNSHQTNERIPTRSRRSNEGLHNNYVALCVVVECTYSILALNQSKATNHRGLVGKYERIGSAHHLHADAERTCRVQKHSAIPVDFSCLLPSHRANRDGVGLDACAPSRVGYLSPLRRSTEN